MSCLDNLAQQYHGLFLLLGVKHNFCQNMYFTKGRFQKKKYWKIPIRRWPPPSLLENIKKKRKMIYAPWNEFCMIWVIFLMPTDQVMAFLCFIFDNQSVDMSGQVWGGGRGGHNWKKQVCLKMVFRQFQVFLALFFFFFYWKIDPRWPPPPPLLEFSNNFIFFIFETFPNHQDW